MNSDSNQKREMLRHALATVAYRAGKTLREAPPQFATFSIRDDARTPAEILAHIGDVLEWGHSIAAGNQVWHDSEPLAWEQEMERFFTTLERFDNFLASEEPLHGEPENLLQGPIADTLTHVGQLAMLRRLADAPVRGENFYAAKIEKGAVRKN